MVWINLRVWNQTIHITTCIGIRCIGVDYCTLVVASYPMASVGFPVLYQLQRNPNCWPFLEPVTKEIAPDYFDVISQPMDISVIRRKSVRKEYVSRQQFVDDFNLIVDNCTKYNGATSGEYQTGPIVEETEIRD